MSELDDSAVDDATDDMDAALLETVEKFLQGEVTSEYLHSRLEDPKGSDPKLWKQLLDLGFFEYFAETPEANPSLLLKINRACGYSALPETLGESLLAGPILLSKLLDKKDLAAVQKLLGEETVGDVISGNARIAPVSISHEVTVGLSEKKGTLSGDLYGVVGCKDLRGLVLSLPKGVRLSALPEVSVSSEHDGSDSLDRVLPRTAIHLKEAKTISLPSLSRALWESSVRLLVVGELLGLADKVISLTVQYVQDRKQFGVPVGSFQAVQHKLVDAYHKKEGLDALFAFAGEALDDASSDGEGDAIKDGTAKGNTVKGNTAECDQHRVLSLVSLRKAIREVPQIIETAIQLHGGIGFTWEYDLHIYLRRAKTFEALYRFSEEEEEEIVNLCKDL